MSRPLRLEFAGALYHITSRGGRRVAIYEADSDRHLFLSVLNPARAEMVRSAQDWRWSSYRAMAGQAKAEPWLDVDWLLASFGRGKSGAINAYRRFVSERKGHPMPWKELKNQVYLGSDDHKPKS